MKKLLLLHLLLAMFFGVQTAGASVVLNATNFPDANFRTYISNETGVSVGGIISDATLASITNINASYKNISSLQGIEYFTDLTHLRCTSNNLTLLDVMKNTKLTYLDCSYNQLTSLDVSKNTNLTKLLCYRNQLSSLDVSNNTNLTELECYRNQLTSLNVLKNTVLTELDCSYNQLTSLNVLKNTVLTKLDCSNNQLTSINVSNNTYLKTFNCGNNPLTTPLNVMNNPYLTSLDCSGNQLTSLDVTKNTKLTGLVCFRNQLTSLDISKNELLWYLDCGYNQLTSLDVSQIKILQQFYCNNNQLTSLNVSNNTKLIYLYCSNNQLTSLNVSNNTKLEDLRCNDNPLTSLDVSKNIALTRLYCNANQLTSLDVSNNTELTTLYCGWNQLSRLDVSNNTKLKELRCTSNNIGSLYLSKNTELELLDCSSNRIDQLNLSNNTKLTELYCGGNRLTYLNLDDNTSLTDRTAVDVGNQSSTRRFHIMSNGSNVNDCWALIVGTTDASRIRNLKIDGVSKTPSFVPRNSDGWMIVSDDLKKIPLKVEYEIYTGNTVAGWMPVTVNYDVKRYGVYIDDIELTSLNFYDIPGLKEGTAYFYDESEGSGLGWSGIVPTLVLYDAKIETKEGIHNIEGYSLNIIVRGDNEVIATDFNAFESYAGVSTTFRGGGTLHLTATSDRWHGIYPCDSRITIKEATKIIVQGDGYGYFDDNSILYIQGNSILACYGNKYPSVELPVVSQRKFDSNIDVRYPVGAYMDSGHHVYYAGTTTDVQKDWVVIGPDNQATQDFIIATGISLTEEGRSQMEDGAIYNLAGQKMVDDKWSNGKLPRGIYIVGGKKIIRN